MYLKTSNKTAGNSSNAGCNGNGIGGCAERYGRPMAAVGIIRDNIPSYTADSDRAIAIAGKPKTIVKICTPPNTMKFADLARCVPRTIYGR